MSAILGLLSDRKLGSLDFQGLYAGNNSNVGSTHPTEVNMAHVILAEVAASIAELKKNPLATVAAGEGFPVAILDRNQPAFYCVPAKAYEALMDKLEDIELNAIADARLADGQALVKVSLDEL
jgi:antitoxin StbD